MLARRTVVAIWSLADTKLDGRYLLRPSWFPSGDAYRFLLIKRPKRSESIEREKKDVND